MLNVENFSTPKGTVTILHKKKIRQLTHKKTLELPHTEIP